MQLYPRVTFLAFSPFNQYTSKKGKQEKGGKNFVDTCD